MALRWWISILVVIVTTEAANAAMDSHSPKARRIFKTIETEYLEVIDCVDIYQQPAFSNPLLKNHTLHMRPGILPPGMKLRDESINESWSCPKGSVPFPRSSFMFPNMDNPRSPRPQGTHSYATMSHSHGEDADIRGVLAAISIWNPNLEWYRDLTIAQVWINNDVGGQPMESIQAGWMVNPVNHNDTILFVYYTNDGYATDCYNYDCRGFVTISPDVILGVRILKPYSRHNGPQIAMSVAIVKDQIAQNWWFYFEGFPVGYWPSRLFTRMSDGANGVQWGGEVVEDDQKIPGGRRRGEDQIGSGCFAADGNGRAAFMKQVYYYNANNELTIPDPVTYRETDPNRYTVTRLGVTERDGPTFYFGGPGRGANSVCGA